MPHIILEFSDNILDDADLIHLFEELHELLVDTHGCEMRELKSRAYLLDHYRVGDGSDCNAFAHLTIRVREGRPAGLLEAMGAAALEILKAHYGRALSEQQCDLTVEICQVPTGCYFKASSAGT